MIKLSKQPFAFGEEVLVVADEIIPTKSPTNRTSHSFANYEEESPSDGLVIEGSFVSGGGEALQLSYKAVDSDERLVCGEVEESQTNMVSMAEFFDGEG